ncbi:MAG: hypothetical protein H6831_11465 [Planctomycetes bacterium]|nr:hypothetical protein [Planctomycetota bacterium]MCB9905018.1 hypothetical protein [Planctomycetota bacterium]
MRRSGVLGAGAIGIVGVLVGAFSLELGNRRVSSRGFGAPDELLSNERDEPRHPPRLVGFKVVSRSDR